MEVEKVMSTGSNSNNTHVKEENVNNNNKEEDDEGTLPGFRFHPTDEELVGFYLKRKVEKKPLPIELIKHIDIYKYDPWDVPISNVGDKEWYFFCIRGRKYRNSIRPNRVTGSGFWKATGIDKPIYSVKEPHDCIGLKKSLVYYRGSAGKGTKTDWMMHEFRLPSDGKTTAAANFPNAKENLDAPQEAEVWTLCRIFKRIPSYKKYIPADNNQNWKESTAPKNSSSISAIISCPVDDSSSKTCSLETDQLDHSAHHHPHNENAQISNSQRKYKKSSSKPVVNNSDQQSDHDRTSHGGWFHVGQFFNNNVNIPLAAHQQNLHHHHQGSIFPGSYPSLNTNPNTADQDFFMNESWDELRSVVQLAVDRHPSQLYDVTDKS